MADYHTNASIEVEGSEEELDCLDRILTFAEELFATFDGEDISSTDDEPTLDWKDYEGWEKLPPKDLAEEVFKIFRKLSFHGSLGFDFFKRTCGDKHYMHLCNDESFNVDAAADLLQLWLQRIDSDLKVVIEWSNTCSKPRTDAYGGGVVVVSKARQRWMSTSYMGEAFVRWPDNIDLDIDGDVPVVREG